MTAPGKPAARPGRTRVLVTGAAGYMGPHVVRALAGAGAAVVGVDRVVPAGLFEGLQVEAVEGDLFADPAALLRQLGPVDACLHLAWEAGFVHDAPVHMLRLSDHVRFLDAVADAGVEQIAAIGSMHEIGYHEGPITQDTPTNPTSQYGIAKDALRRSLLAKHAKTDTVVQWLRCFYVYGDDARNSSIFAKIAAAAAEGRTTFPFTSGRNRYDFLEIGELAAQLTVAVLQQDVTGVINCCSGNPVPLGEKVEAYIRERGFGITLEYGAFPDRPYDSPGVWGDPSKIRTILEAASLADR